MRETHNGNDYRPGDPWVTCDECGLEYHRSETRKRWDGLIVCKNDWEPRHQQEQVRGKTERIAVNDPRPVPSPKYLSTNEVTQDSL